MLATLTNTSGRALNSNIVEDLTTVDGVDLRPFGAQYIGGAVRDPFPHPFNLVGELADAANVVQPMHPADWRRQEPLTDGAEPRRLWNGLIQAGLVTLGFAQETNRTDTEELFLTAV